MKWQVRAAAATFGILALSTQANAGPAVATRWKDVTVSQGECLQRAEQAIGKTGFRQIERTEQSRYGTLKGYTAAIRCITSNGLAIFIASGPSRTRSDQLAGALFENWK